MFIFINKELWIKYGKYLFFAVFFVMFALSLCYVYLINLAVLKTATITKNLSYMNQLESRVQELEVAYIDKLGKLNIPYAKELGFVEAEPVSFIYVQRAVAQIDDYGQRLR
ncbi:hypothetical protein KKB69_02455 [Patescibacteria group bacterium]|nr:hypothetical protein [Patescibacteria group bacterium]